MCPKLLSFKDTGSSGKTKKNTVLHPYHKHSFADCDDLADLLVYLFIYHRAIAAIKIQNK